MMESKDRGEMRTRTYEHDVERRLVGGLHEGEADDGDVRARQLRWLIAAIRDDDAR